MSTPTMISDTFWTGSTARALRAHPAVVREVQFYLLTCPEKNPYGLYILESDLLDRRLHGAERDFLKALAVLNELGFCCWDVVTRWVWIVEMARWQFSSPLKASDYRNLAVKKWYRQAPTSPFIGMWYDRYRLDFHLDQDPQAVERREHVVAWKGLPSPIEGAPKSLSTIRTVPASDFDLVPPEKEQQTLLPVPLLDRVLPPGERQVAFERLWAVYPNGKEKKPARDYFVEKMKVTPKLVDTIEAAIRLHATSHDWLKDGGQFVPRLVNWLKREGWEDRIRDTHSSGPVLSEKTQRNLTAAERFALGGEDEKAQAR